jgi:hypothetical protein
MADLARDFRNLVNAENRQADMVVHTLVCALSATAEIRPTLTRAAVTRGVLGRDPGMNLPGGVTTRRFLAVGRLARRAAAA